MRERTLYLPKEDPQTNMSGSAPGSNFLIVPKSCQIRVFIDEWGSENNFCSRMLV